MEQRRKTAVPLTTLVNYSCGCGFRTHKEHEAKYHAIEVEHVLTINGTIGPVKPHRKEFTGEIHKDGNNN